MIRCLVYPCQIFCGRNDPFLLENQFWLSRKNRAFDSLPKLNWLLCSIASLGEKPNKPSDIQPIEIQIWSAKQPFMIFLLSFWIGRKERWIQTCNAPMPAFPRVHIDGAVANALARAFLQRVEIYNVHQWNIVVPMYCWILQNKNKGIKVLLSWNIEALKYKIK